MPFNLSSCRRAQSWHTPMWVQGQPFSGALVHELQPKAWGRYTKKTLQTLSWKGWPEFQLMLRIAGKHLLFYFILSAGRQLGAWSLTAELISLDFRVTATMPTKANILLILLPDIGCTCLSPGDLNTNNGVIMWPQQVWKWPECERLTTVLLINGPQTTCGLWRTFFLAACLAADLSRVHSMLV